MHGRTHAAVITLGLLAVACCAKRVTPDAVRIGSDADPTGEAIEPRTAAAVTHAAPMSDLAADLAARAARARAQLGEAAAVQVEGDVFLLAAPRHERSSRPA